MLKKTERLLMQHIAQTALVLDKMCEIVVKNIRRDGPSLDESGGPVSRSKTGRDPVAILVANWPFRFAPTVPSFSEDQEKLVKRSAREWFGQSATAYHYEKFFWLLEKLQEAHDAAFEGMAPEELAACREEFEFRVREIRRQIMSQKAAADLAKRLG